MQTVQEGSGIVQVLGMTVWALRVLVLVIRIFRVVTC